MSSALSAFGRMLLRQQQPRFEVGEPRRHHQIVGGKFQPHFSRRLDEGEILVGQRQDGNLGEIDLLLAGERQQQVERTFKALDIDHQRRLVRAALRKLGFELQLFGVHAEPCAGCQTPAIESRRIRRGWRQRRSAPAVCAAPARPRPGARLRRPAPALRRRPRAFPAFCRCNGAPCRSPPRSPPWRARRASPTSAPIEISSLIKKPRKPNRITNHVPHYSGRSGGRRDRVDSCEHNMCSHPQRQTLQAAEKRQNRWLPASPGRCRPPAACRGCRRWRGRGRGCA